MSSKDPPFTEDGNEFEKHHHDTPTGRKGSCMKLLKDNLFMILILVGVLVGFGLGFGLRAATDSPIAEQWINLIGTLYIHVLDLTILPLIVSNLIIGVGITKVENVANEDDPNLRATTSDVFADLILNIFPDNIVAMCIQQTKTHYEYKAGTNETEKVRIVGTASSKDLIGILVVSIAFGLAAKAAGKKGKAFLEFFQSLCEVTLKLVRVFLLLTPGGVCFMIAGAVMGVEDIAGTFSKVGMFVVTVTAGIAVVFILVLLLYLATTMSNPFIFFPRTIKASFISFATTSPIVALPEMFEGCDEFGIRKEISRFFCPIATTMKSDGPAVFISSACIFVAQLELNTVPPTTVVVIWLLTSVSVMAIPHIPSASIVIAMTILNSAGIPTRSTVYLYAVDWLLDRFRAGVSTAVTMYGAAILHGYDQRKSAKEDHNFIDEIDQPSTQGSQI
ncbi:Excitatory amino acid transporter 3 [Taenia solium]|eukprot:TsM_001103200 transcript=TsM_001103200 gene=TsM_001103200